VLLIRSALAYLALIAAILAPLPGMAGLGAAAVSLAVILGWRNIRLVPKVMVRKPDSSHARSREVYLVGKVFGDN